MSLESLVPPLPLCQQLQPVDFPESAMVYEVYHYQYKLDPHVMDRETSKTTRPESCESVHAAPTTDEIKDKLRKKYTVFSRTLRDGRTVISVHIEGKDISEIDEKPATAALRLWMKVNGREVKG